MDGSGLKEALCEIYAENSVAKMLEGKAYSRGLRGHSLVQVALSNIILNEMELDDFDRARLQDVVKDVGYEIFQEKAKSEEVVKLKERF